MKTQALALVLLMAAVSAVPAQAQLAAVTKPLQEHSPCLALFCVYAPLSRLEEARPTPIIPGVPVPILVPIDLPLAEVDAAAATEMESCYFEAVGWHAYPQYQIDECIKMLSKSGQADRIYTLYCQRGHPYDCTTSDGSSHVRVHKCPEVETAFDCSAWMWWIDIDDGVPGKTGTSGETGKVVYAVSQKVGQTVAQNTVDEDFYGHFGAGAHVK